MRQLQQKQARGPLEYGIVRSKIGEKKGADEWYADMHTNSNVAEYKADSPAGYTVPLEDEKKLMLRGDGIRPKGTSRIGDEDADEVGEMKQMISENSNEEEWKAGADVAYAKNVGFDKTFAQLVKDDEDSDDEDPFKSRLVDDQYGVDEVKEIVSANSDEEDYVGDSPKDYIKQVGVAPVKP